MTKAVAVVTNAVIASDVITDEYAPIADATITDAHIGVVDHAVIAAVGALPAAHNNCTTTPYNNLMSASRRESAGRSFEPSNVNGINNQHEMWIRQCMKDDWGIQYPHEFQIRTIHHIAFQRDQILYIVAKTDGEIDAPVDQHPRDCAACGSELARLVDDIEAGGGGEDVAKDRNETDNRVEAELDAEQRELSIETLLQLFQLRYAITFAQHAGPPSTLLRRHYVRVILRFGF
jgi:hypothetical protein